MNRNSKIILSVSLAVIVVLSLYFVGSYMLTGSLPLGSPNLVMEEWNSHSDYINMQYETTSDKTWHLFWIYPQVRITNQGNGVATNLQVRYEVKSGQLDDDNKKIENVQNINAGESETLTTYFSTGWLPDWESYPTYNVEVTMYSGNTQVESLTIYITPPKST